MESSTDRIRAVLSKIPRGRVVTYGEIAERAGVPRAARLVVRTLHGCGDEIPWHRVIGKRSEGRGEIRIGHPLGAKVQRQLLEKEGVRFDESGAVDLGRYGWGATRRPRIR